MSVFNTSCVNSIKVCKVEIDLLLLLLLLSLLLLLLSLLCYKMFHPKPTLWMTTIGMRIPSTTCYPFFFFFFFSFFFLILARQNIIFKTPIFTFRFSKNNFPKFQFSKNFSFQNNLPNFHFFKFYFSKFYSRNPNFPNFQFLNLIFRNFIFQK